MQMPFLWETLISDFMTTKYYCLKGKRKVFVHLACCNLAGFLPGVWYHSIIIVKQGVFY